MSDWRLALKGDPIDWLLEPDNPSVRYLALTELAGRSPRSAAARQARADIMKVGPVPIILFKQEKDGHWGRAEDFYVRSKYRGTVWSIITLAELGADGSDERVRRAAEFIMTWSQDRTSGAFAYRGTAKEGGSPADVAPCLTGNMVWSLIRFGYIDDPGVQFGIDWAVKYMRFDDGNGPAPSGWPYDRFEKCWGRHTCHMGVVKLLKALAEVPPNKRSRGVKWTIEDAAEYLLKHHVHKRSHDLSQVSKPEWLKFGFPLLWNTDVLEVLGILTRLGYRDERMQEAIDLVVSKQDEQGRWALESTYNGRMQTRIEQQGKPSKWVTLNALRVLKRFYE